jgi:hypothetical protein
MEIARNEACLAPSGQTWKENRIAKQDNNDYKTQRGYQKGLHMVDVLSGNS